MILRLLKFVVAVSAAGFLLPPGSIAQDLQGFVRPNHQHQSPEYWAQQLQSDNYQRRELAKQRLIAAGNAAVPAISQALENSDLESTELAIRALGEIALAQPADEIAGAWGLLSLLATKSAGLKASRSLGTLQEVNVHRSAKAVAELIAAGVRIDMDDFVVQAISERQIVVQIDERFQGEIEVLHWLRWVRGIQFARVKNQRVRKDILEQLVLMPDLKTIALVDGELTPDALTPLQQMRSIHSLELRYIRVPDSLLTQMAKLPIRSALSLRGTGLQETHVATLREAMPNLKIEFNRGGFMGVQCPDGFNQCEITQVIPGSGAQRAGLLPGDVIIKANDRNVRSFAELRAIIGEHDEGNPLSVQYSRNGKLYDTTVILGRLEDQ
jgi:hypothetical protein